MNSIEWFISELKKVNYHPTEAMVMYAKKLQRQEHSKTWDEALRIFETRGHNFVRAWEDFDDYYQETFISKGSGIEKEQEIEFYKRELEYERNRINNLKLK
jgi:hypothetical protein